MAVLISAADGNLTSVSTVWDIVSTGTGAIQAVKTSSTNTTTSYVYSSAFTGTNLDIVDGLLLFCNRVNTTGTVTVALSEDNGTTDTRNLAVNASDLPVDPSWVFFKFGSSLTLDGGTDYKVGIKGSSAGNATFYRDGTAGNWAHYLRKVSLATAGAGDVMYIAGEITGAGATTTRTITMDSTATTDYGTGTDGAIDNGIEIGNAGILQYGTSAATNYYLKLSGSLNVWGNGTLNIGTVATAIPRDSTAVLEFDPVADGGMGLIANPGGILNIQGLSRTSGKNIFACKLNTDEAVNSTSLGIDTDTGWLDNDQIVVAATTRTYSQSELGALNGNANAADITVDGFAGVGGGLAFAHSGTSPTQGEIINITRNVKIRSATSTIMAYVFCNTTSIVDIDWAEFYYLGENATNKRGIEIATTTGSFSMQFSSVHDTEDFGIKLIGGSCNNIVFSSNVCYNLNTVAASSTTSLDVVATSGTAITINGNYFILFGAPNTTTIGGITIADVGITFTNNVLASSSSSSAGALLISEQAVMLAANFTGNVIHSSNGRGMYFSSILPPGGVLDGMTSWGNNSNGIDFGTSTASYFYVTNSTFFGNSGTNIGESNSTPGYLEFRNCSIQGHATLTVQFGFQGVEGVTVFKDCNFGTVTTHTTSDLSTGNHTRIYLFNTTLASTELTTTTIAFDSFVKSQKHDASATTFKATYKFGTILAVADSNRDTASGYAWKMTPNTANSKLILPGPTPMDETFRAAVNASTLVTITARVMKDGSYNGNAPRLVMPGGIIGGIGSDVIASLTVGASTYETLQVTGTPNELGVVEFYIDCDGTAGNIYVDNITVSQA